MADMSRQQFEESVHALSQSGIIKLSRMRWPRCSCLAQTWHGVTQRQLQPLATPRPSEVIWTQAWHKVAGSKSWHEVTQTTLDPSKVFQAETWHVVTRGRH